MSNNPILDAVNPSTVVFRNAQGLSTPASPINPLPVTMPPGTVTVLTEPGTLTPLGFIKITSLSAAVGLGSVPAGARVALLQSETKSVRWRDDGTSPTSSVGNLLAAGDSILYDGDLEAIELIETAASASVNVSFYS